MAIDAGDVVITFLGDTTQLDQTFNNVAGKVDTVNKEAAASTTVLKAAQQELKAALAAVMAEGGNTVANLERLAEAEARLTVAAAEAKAQHAALKNELLEESMAAKLGAGINEELTGAVTGMLAAFATVEAVKGFIEHVQKSVLELELLSEKTGIGIDKLAGLQHVAEANGVSFDAVGNGLVRLERAQTIAIEKAGQQRDAFARVGISLEEIKKSSPLELLYRLADAMENGKTHGEAITSAITLFGKGGAALIPILQMGGEELRKMTDEAARNSGVTQEAGEAAKKWEAETANLSTAFRGALIPVMQALVQLLPYVITGFDVLWLALKEIGVGIGGLFMAIYDGFGGVTKIIEDLVLGNFQKAVSDAQVMGSEFAKNWQTTMGLWKGEYQSSAEFLKEVWAKTAPLKPPEDDMDHVKEKSKITSQDLIQDAKAASEGVIAQINLRKAANTLAFDQGKIDADTWAKADVQATVEARDAHVKFLEDVVRIHRAAGEAEKAQTAQRELENQKIKDATALTTDLAKATEANKKETEAFDKTAEKTWGDMNKEIAKTTDAVKEMERRQPFTGMIQHALELTEDLKKLGIEGWGQAATRLDLATKAEAHLNAMGIRDGKIWLEVQKAKLEAMIAVAKIEGQSTKQMENDLAKVEQKLKHLQAELPTFSQAWTAFKDVMKVSVADFAGAMGEAFAAVIEGQKSASDAIKQSVGQLIKSLCDYWANFFAAMAIADMFWNPAKAAAELAAVVALRMAGALAGSMGSGSSSGGGGGGGSAGGVSGQQANIPQGTATQAGQPVTAQQNVPHFARGALVSEPTLAMIGEERRREAIIPLDDPEAIERIGSALGGGAIHNHFYIKGMISTGDLSHLGRTITRASQTGRLRVTVANSNRITRKT